MVDINKIARDAKTASVILKIINSKTKDMALIHVADALDHNKETILKANQLDIRNAESQQMSPAMVDRLLLDEKRWAGVVADLREVIELPDPVGEIIERQELGNGLKVRKQSVPLGVLAVIYEARPNVTVDVVGLALKSGNAVILRGGKETIHTNQAIVKVIKNALTATGIPEDAIQFIDDPDRSKVMELMKMYDDIDMLIPRGGAGLHKFCRENSLVPVITGGIGICHLYVDASADLSQSVEVIRNAKIQRPSVCNALDTVLVHKDIAREFVPVLICELNQNGVNFKADPLAYKLVSESNSVDMAGPDDFDTEWLSLVLGIKVVESLEEAINHITEHGTAHSDGILTSDEQHACEFISRVDSAAVYVNASTRFTDGAQFGLGAEIAVSTQKLHARGPMGLRELTSYKWVVEGQYHIRR